MTNGSDAAQPQITTEPTSTFSRFGEHHYGDVTSSGGLTKREYFAAMALSGMVANYDRLQDGDNSVAVDAVRLADRLIEALNQ